MKHNILHNKEYTYCNVNSYVCMYVCMYVRTYVCMYVRTYICMYVCMHVCMYVRTYVCMNACMYTTNIPHTHTERIKIMHCLRRTSMSIGTHVQNHQDYMYVNFLIFLWHLHIIVNHRPIATYTMWYK